MSLEGLFEINYHKAAFTPCLTLLLITADSSSAWKCTVHVPCFPSLLNSTTQNQSWVMLRMQGQQASHAAKSSRQASGGGGSEVRRRQSEAEGRRTADKMRRHVVCWHVLTSANSSPDIPVYGSQTRTSVWEVGLPTVEGRTQKSGMNVKGNIKFILRNIKHPNQINPLELRIFTMGLLVWLVGPHCWDVAGESSVRPGSQWNNNREGFLLEKLQLMFCFTATGKTHQDTNQLKNQSFSDNPILDIQLLSDKVSNHSI